jgi:hypothetical protein
MKNKGSSIGNLEQDDRHLNHSGECEVIQDEVTTGRMSIQVSLLTPSLLFLICDCAGDAHKDIQRDIDWTR